MGITIATDFLDIKGLFNLTCQVVADYIKDKNHILFNIKNNFTRQKKKKLSVERMLRLLSKLLFRLIFVTFILFS